MFTNYDATNYFCNEGLLIWYEQEIADNNYVKLTRHATKSYGYLNMASGSADTCAAALVSKYTRSFAAWTLSDTTVTQTYVTECKSEILKSQTACGSFDVTASVNETDVKYVYSSSGFVSNPANSFTNENARDYDESVHAKTADGATVYTASKNLKVTQDLAIRYVTERLGSGYKYTRYASKSFTYLGMRQSTAENCAKAKRSQYTRIYYYLSGTTVKSKIANGASVSLRHNGRTWLVDVRISETDVRYSATNVSPSTLFTAENSRSYEGSGLLSLTSVSLGETVEGELAVRATATGSCNIPGYTLNDTTFEYRIGDEVTWSSTSVNWTEGTGTLTLPVTSESISCRLICADTESDVVIAT